MSSRNCRFCGVSGAVSTRPPGHREILVIEDPVVKCVDCGVDWIAAGARFVVGDPPPVDESGADDWFQRYTAATNAGDGGVIQRPVETFERGATDERS